MAYTKTFELYKNFLSHENMAPPNVLAFLGLRMITYVVYDAA